ncbi:MAG: glucose-1-phosphate thymidylyltransferase RfbA [Verrucomicrobiota bacterium JB022]|nr:glucose-1-phosphate thymidylyltransferase RfbA [Verrucomicrobiota bacterium JB022]
MAPNRKGIILAGGSGTRLYPLTLPVSKQLMPVYDKPMIYYPISVLMLAGIREMMVISTPQDLPMFQRLLGDGSQFGVHFSYAEQPSPDGIAQAFTIAENWLAGAPSALVLGDNLFYGTGLPQQLRAAAARDDGATVFVYQVADPHRYGVVGFNEAGQVDQIIEKPADPPSDWAVVGLYYFNADAPRYAREQKPSARGELEITDLAARYLREGQMHVEKLGRGTAWLDTGTHQSLLDAGQFIGVMQERTGLAIACLEEIAWRMHWIDDAALTEQARRMGKSSYAQYLHKLLKQ